MTAESTRRVTAGSMPAGGRVFPGSACQVSPWGETQSRPAPETIARPRSARRCSCHTSLRPGRRRSSGRCVARTAASRSGPSSSGRPPWTDCWRERRGVSAFDAKVLAGLRGGAA